MYWKQLELRSLYVEAGVQGERDESPGCAGSVHQGVVQDTRHDQAHPGEDRVGHADQGEQQDHDQDPTRRQC